MCIDIHLLSGAQTIGIECIEERLIFAQKMTHFLKLNTHCKYIKNDFFEMPLPKVSHVYITCTCFSSETLTKLTQKLNSIEPGTIIITVTRALSVKNVELCKSFNATFDWGRDMIFIYRKI